jgi:hypothetical protein
MGTARAVSVAPVSDHERLRILAKFIRGQAHLAEGHPAKPGPGDVHLSHEEALLAADALDEHCEQLAAIENPVWSWKNLAEFFKRHAIMGKAPPRCFVCHHTAMQWAPDKRHPDLPNILVCEQCVDRALGPSLKL